MSAEDNLSQELFFSVHRGIAAITPQDVDKGSVGHHWSADRRVANIFAIHPDAEKGDYETRTRHKSTVLHGQIPMSSVETNTEKLSELGVQTHDPEFEKEVTAKRGALVKVTGMTTITPVSRVRTRERKRTYNPPREMKA